MNVTVRITRFCDGRTAAQRAEWERQEQARAALRIGKQARNRAWATGTQALRQRTQCAVGKYAFDVLHNR